MSNSTLNVGKYYIVSFNERADSKRQGLNFIGKLRSFDNIQMSFNNITVEPNVVSSLNDAIAVTFPKSWANLRQIKD